MKRFTPSYLAARRKNAFSLVEVVIAMGVTTFCLITMLGLLPIGAGIALESRRETRAAYLAQQILGDLRSSSFTEATILCQTNGTLVALPSFSLADATTNCVTCDGDNNVLYQATANQYASGVSDTSANYLVQVTVQPSSLNNLSTISVEVSAPAQAPLSARSRYAFQTMIGNMQ